ncbi:response regulator [Dysgonomonas sp. 521]|uniref:hybrid sensor histidine kinase/response regulator transcription factor n=1 Tax=Dysgonomonas sp. 521 TaxID=2302932 RepID=UPI0013D090EA|nr:hybrid sensor histidine kinase/response regulator transcription factor [Dysgonomonas sp. 521]NDV95914.1 response regulator [Dysgonomonas sp. 521]
MHVTRFFLLFFCVFVSCVSADSVSEEFAGPEIPVIAGSISNQKITAIAEDAQGYIWLGSFRGLNRYNVHEFHQYFCTDDSLGIPDNQITDILLDSKKRLWIATVNGVCLYTDKDNFRLVPMRFTDKNVQQLVEDKEGRIFCKTMTQLYVYNPDTGEIDREVVNPVPEGNYFIRCYVDAENNLWVSGPAALLCYNPATLQLKDSFAVEGSPYCSYLHNNELWLAGNHSVSVFDIRMRCFKEVPEVIKGHPVLANADIDYIHPYANNCLLLNTSKDGMFCYNYMENVVMHEGENDFPFEVPRFKISKMFTDSQQNLWIGSEDQGYTVRYHYKERFNTNNYLRSSMENKSVVSVAAGTDRKLWIATLMDGVFVYDLESRQISAIDIESLFIQDRQKAFFVNQIFVDNDNAVWMSATNHEVLRCRYVNGRLQVEERFYIHAPMSISQGADGTIWIGTGSVFVHALQKGEKSFRAIQVFEGFTFIPGLLPRGSELMMAAFNQPLKLIDTESEKVREVAVPEEDMAVCVRRSVLIPTVLYEDSRGNVWMGTLSNGLMCYNPSTGRMRPVPGTACPDISGIEEDAQGHLWISTQYGLSKYDPTTERFTNYYTMDGIGGNQFYDRASCRMPDGILVFGGTHGLTFFNPIDVPVKRSIPLLFEDLKVHNRLIHPQDLRIIDRHLSYGPDIRLGHDQNSFSISFAALDYCEYERVHYHYKMEGFDKYWIDARNNREAYYANLPAGKYVFKVKVTNSSNSIMEAESSIWVVVRPAPWLTWWALCIYFLLAAGLFLVFLRGLLRIRAEKEATRRAKLEKEQEQRVNLMNMSFFANVSHEFRTPLTMITGPVTQLCNNPGIDGENKKLLYIVQRSVDRMLRLVNQLLDFNKLENDTLKLKVVRGDIIACLQRQVDVFRVNAADKGVYLNTYGLEDTFLQWLDEDKVEKIFANLLSNALKFTPAGGKVSVYFDVITHEEAGRIFGLKEKDRDSQYVKVSVANTGQSIPEELQEKIFERYYQVENQTQGRYNWGTGIGLYYARSLAELHHGYIKAGTPEDGNGAVFTFILPVNDVSYPKEVRSTEQGSQAEVFPLPVAEVEKDAEAVEEADRKKTILVAEDDTEVSYYLKTLLSPYYRVVNRFDADSALKAMQEELPDLVLSDVVMPDKDGYRFCREIKDDLQLCHIPVILVTAKATVKNQVEGLNCGADAYVTKPFEPSYLLALIHSQLANREKVRSLLGKATQTDKIAENVLSPHDNAFMTDLYRLMENELSNPELDIARMTEMMLISRTKFYYKVKGLTGENPSVFFKTYKLNRAAELISEGKYTVSEIADLTGFSTLSHFSRSFKKQFGVSPSEYR